MSSDMKTLSSGNGEVGRGGFGSTRGRGGKGISTTSSFSTSNSEKSVDGFGNSSGKNILIFNIYWYLLARVFNIV